MNLVISSTVEDHLVDVVEDEGQDSSDCHEYLEPYMDGILV